MSMTAKSSPHRELLTIQVALRFCAVPGRYQWKGEAGRFQFGLGHRDDIVDWNPEPDPWEARKAFFNVDPDDVIALDLFVDRFGCFGPWPGLTTADFARWRELLLAAWKKTMPVSRWPELSERFPAGMVMQLTRPARLKAVVVGEREPRIVEARCALEAIIWSIAFDKMRGYGLRYCARCGRPFRTRGRNPGRKQIYCDSKTCGHRAAVQAYKARLRRRQEG